MSKFEGDKLEMAGTVGQLACELENVLRAFYQMLVKNTDQENATDFVDRICANAKKTQKQSVSDDLEELEKMEPGLASILKKLFEEDQRYGNSIKT